MKSFFLFFTLLTINFSANAAEQIGEIHCYTLDRPVSYMIHADIFGTKSGKDVRFEYANINLSSYNWDSNENGELFKNWQNVSSMSDCHFSEHFKSHEVELDAYYDDVGAMSSISFEGEEYQLACSIEL